jgi:hypothetical protein
MFRSLCDHHQAFLRIKSINAGVFDVSCFIILRVILNLKTSGCLQSNVVIPAVSVNTRVEERKDGQGRVESW